MLGYDNPVKIGKIKDGTSKTMMVFEKRLRPPYALQGDDDRGGGCKRGMLRHGLRLDHDHVKKVDLHVVGKDWRERHCRSPRE